MMIFTFVFYFWKNRPSWATCTGVCVVCVRIMRLLRLVEVKRKRFSSHTTQNPFSIIILQTYLKRGLNKFVFSFFFAGTRVIVVVVVVFAVRTDNIYIWFTTISPTLRPWWRPKVRRWSCLWSRIHRDQNCRWLPRNPSCSLLIHQAHKFGKLEKSRKRRKNIRNKLRSERRTWYAKVIYCFFTPTYYSILYYDDLSSTFCFYLAILRDVSYLGKFIRT